MAYKQTPGRGPMMKTGRGLRPDLVSPARLDDDKKKPKMVDVKATSGSDSWMMSVAEGSRMHKMSQKLGTVPSQFRNLEGVTKETDPFASGISEAEQKKRMKSWASQQK
jgi:hypothetical protein